MAAGGPRLKGKFAVKTRSWESGLPMPLTAYCRQNKGSRLGVARSRR